MNNGPTPLFKEIQRAKISKKINDLGQFFTSPQLKNKTLGGNIQDIHSESIIDKNITKNSYET